MKRIHIILLFLPILWFCDLSASEIGSKFGIGFSVNTQKLYGDTRSGQFVFGGSPLVLRYNFKPNGYLETDLSYGQLATKMVGGTLETSLISIGAKVGYRFLHESKLNPLLYVGIGVFNFKYGNSSRFWDGYGALGAGAELFIVPSLSLNLTGDFRYTSGDDFDGGRKEQGKDGFFNISFGINYYLGAKRTNEFYSELPPWYTEDELTTEEVPEEQPDLTVLTFQRDELLDSIEKKEQALKLLRVKVQGFDRYIAYLEDNLYSNGVKNTNRFLTEEKAYDPYFMQFQDGLAFYEAGQFERAVSTLKNLVRIDPENPRAGNWWYWLGESYYGKGDYFSAARAFETALAKENNPTKQSLSRLMLGLSRWKVGDLNLARVDFEKLLSRNPGAETELLLQEYLAQLDLEGAANE